MIILTARADGVNTIAETCHEAADLCNRLGIALDLTIGDHAINVYPGDHPYNLEQEYIYTVQRAEGSGA